MKANELAASILERQGKEHSGQWAPVTAKQASFLFSLSAKEGLTPEVFACHSGAPVASGDGWDLYRYPNGAGMIKVPGRVEPVAVAPESPMASWVAKYQAGEITADKLGAIMRATTLSQEPENAETIANMGIGAQASLAALMLGEGGQDNLCTWLASYVGAYESIEAWAQEELATCGMALPEGLEQYFDFAAYAADCLHGCSYYAQELDGLIYIFRD